MIDITPTKGYDYIKIEIYHNNECIDFDSIKEEFENNLKELQENECDIMEDLRD